MLKPKNEVFFLSSKYYSSDDKIFAKIFNHSTMLIKLHCNGQLYYPARTNQQKI